MANANIQIEITALDRASRKLDDISRSLNPMKGKVAKIDKEFDKVDKSINRTSGSFGRFKGLLAGAITVAGITSFTRSVVEASSRAEDLKTTLETVTGSAKAGDDAFKFINDFATRTPFDIETLTETFIKLQAAGIEPTEELLTTFGDMASVTTDRVGSLNAITDLFARTTSGGLGLEDLNRLADRGIPVFQIFEEKLGLARLEVSEFGKTAEGAAQLKDALLEGLNEDFGGGMEKASANLSVSLSNMGIAANNALIAVGEGGLSDAINKAATTFTSFLGNNEELALALGEKLGQAVTFVTDGIIMLFENMDKAQPIFDLLGALFTNVVAPAFSMIFDLAVKLAEAMTPIVERLGPVMGTVFEGLAGVMETVVIPIFMTVIDTITMIVEKIQGMISWITEGIDTVKNFGSGVADSVTGGFNKAGDAIGGWVDGGKENIYGFYDWAVGNSVIPDLVNDIGKYMDMMPKKMVDPIAKAVDESKNVMNKLPTAINPNVISSPVSGVGAGVSTGFGAGNATSNMNFNISGVNAGQTGEYQSREMRKYIEGVAVQVAHTVLRQNTSYGGLI